LPSGIPGIGLEIDGAMQHAPHPSRHACGGGTSAHAGRTGISTDTRLSLTNDEKRKNKKTVRQPDAARGSLTRHCAIGAATLLHNAAESRVHILERV
jgi:hypothetical protein